jgi:hypothetical protein
MDKILTHKELMEYISTSTKERRCEKCNALADCDEAVYCGCERKRKLPPYSNNLPERIYHIHK